ncbi:MAG: hypothetical protein ACPMAQ_10430 [Phycisphaerae bacterium]
MCGVVFCGAVLAIDRMAAAGSNYCPCDGCAWVRCTYCFPDEDDPTCSAEVIEPTGNNYWGVLAESGGGPTDAWVEVHGYPGGSYQNPPAYASFEGQAVARTGYKRIVWCFKNESGNWCESVPPTVFRASGERVLRYRTEGGADNGDPGTNAEATASGNASISIAVLGSPNVTVESSQSVNITNIENTTRTFNFVITWPPQLQVGYQWQNDRWFAEQELRNPYICFVRTSEFCSGANMMIAEVTLSATAFGRAIMNAWGTYLMLEARMDSFSFEPVTAH